MNALGRKTKTLKEGEANLGGDHIREGLSAIISVKVPEPEFEGQTKTRLGNPEVRKILDSVTTKVQHSAPPAVLLSKAPVLSRVAQGSCSIAQWALPSFPYNTMRCRSCAGPDNLNTLDKKICSAMNHRQNLHYCRNADTECLSCITMFRV